MSIDNNQSFRSDVLDAVVALLPKAERCRFKPYAVEELPARNVIPDEDYPQHDMPGKVYRTFRFHVRHIVASVDGPKVKSGAEKKADSEYCETARLLNADPTLGDRVLSLREVKTHWDYESAELQQVALVSTYEATFYTLKSDPRLRA